MRDCSGANHPYVVKGGAVGPPQNKDVETAAKKMSEAPARGAKPSAGLLTYLAGRYFWRQ